MCLVSREENGNSSNHMFAVEFDTYPNEINGDPWNNHIGVDINSVYSIATHELPCALQGRRCNYFCQAGTAFTAWIDYDGETQVLDVRFANASDVKPAAIAIHMSELDLSTVFHDYMYVGFSGSTGTCKEIHKIYSWSFQTSGASAFSSPTPTPTPMPLSFPSPSPCRHQQPHARIRVSLSVILSACGACTATFVLFILFWFRHQKKLRMEQISQGREPATNRHLDLGPQLYTYRELRKATKNFSDGELLGSGGFGVVYKGTLQPSGALIAVKRCKKPNSKHGEDGFIAEATSISQIRHRNLVQLQGWCHEKGQLLLVYDYMPNKSLAQWLFSGSNTHRSLKLEASCKSLNPLTWDLRYKILAGVAAAVAYLHEDWQQCVLHRDIKASNVMLDADFNAHLGDFGLARLIDHQKVEKTTVAAGTLGYMAPEMPYTGKASKETDVYSFGVLVLEVVCGRRAIDTLQTDREDLMLVDSVWHALEAGNLLSIVDPCFVHRHSSDCTKISGIESNSADMESSLHDSTAGDIHPTVMPVMQEMPSEQWDSMGDMLRLGLLCSHPIPSARPPMRIVNRAFQSGDMAILPPLPTKKPILMEFAAQAIPFHQEIISPHYLSADDSNATGSTSSS